MGTCRDPSDMCGCDMGLLFEINNKLELNKRVENYDRSLTRTSIFLGKLFASKNVLTPSEQLKKASHIKQSVLNSVQNHGEKLLQVGPNSKKLVKIKRLSVTYYNTHIMLAFSSYRNQLFGLQGKCSGCMIRILVLIGLNQQTISHCNVVYS